MPFIRSKVNVPVSKEQERKLKEGLGKAIARVPGKSEQYLMLKFEDNSHLYFQGRNDFPIAYIEAALFGNEMHYGYDEFVSDVTKLYEEVLGIPKETVFIRFEDIPDWAEGGMNFDRNRYE